ncbi:MAG: hypothetical protein HYS15_00570 [Candidatus Spechtbacteria bacterium]|nr:hypothetical protein [Candidatus Spechtbacteria bacterium]
MRQKKRGQRYDKGPHRFNRFLGNCPVCDKKFTTSSTSLLEERGEMRTLYVECAKCDTSVVLGVMRNAPGIVTTVGMLTDMRREDIDRMKDFPPLTFDDVLEVHRYLESS